VTIGGAVSVGFHGSHMDFGTVSQFVSKMTIYDTMGNRHDLTVSHNRIHWLSIYIICIFSILYKPKHTL